MLKAVIFDFDGVIADAEPLHMRCFQDTFSPEGIELSEEDYYDKYLAYDDKTCITELLKDNGFRHDSSIVERLMLRKAEFFQQALHDGVDIYPGVFELVTTLHVHFPVAIGSGALKKEIEYILETIGLKDFFMTIVSANEVKTCKPDPSVFSLALSEINRIKKTKISSSECLVVEDSVFGVEAAKRAGMKCLAVTNSYSEIELRGADKIVDSLEEVSIDDLSSLFQILHSRVETVNK